MTEKGDTVYPRIHSLLIAWLELEHRSTNLITFLGKKILYIKYRSAMAKRAIKCPQLYKCPLVYWGREVLTE